MNELKVIGKQKVGEIQFTGIEGGFGENKKAMLVKDIAAIHGQPIKQINRRINENKKRFHDGVDIIDLKTGALNEPVLNQLFTKAQVGNSNNLYMLSERGYSKLLKILEDDTAWELYDKLVDGYFAMRQSIKENAPELLKNKRLEIMAENAKTRKAQLAYKIAMGMGSETAKQRMLAESAEMLTGEKILPIMKNKEYSATDVGEKLGISANMVGKIANRIEIKAEQPGQNEFGRWANNKSQHSSKEVAQWLYFEKGLEAIRKEVKK